MKSLLKSSSCTEFREKKKYNCETCQCWKDALTDEHNVEAISDVEGPALESFHKPIPVRLNRPLEMNRLYRVYGRA